MKLLWKDRKVQHAIILIHILVMMCTLSACTEVTADHVLQKTQAVDYENMTFEEMLTAAIGCSEATSNLIAQTMYKSGIEQITEIERFEYSTKEKIGSWTIETDQIPLTLRFGKTEADVNLSIYNARSHSLITDGKPETLIHFIDSSDFKLFEQETDGIALSVDDGRAARSITIQNKDFIHPWTIFYQGEQLCYLNEIEMLYFGSDNRLSSAKYAFELVVDQDGETYLKIDDKKVPVTDQFRSFTNGAEKRSISVPDVDAKFE